MGLNPMSALPNLEQICNSPQFTRAGKEIAERVNLEKKYNSASEQHGKESIYSVLALKVEKEIIEYYFQE